MNIQEKFSIILYGHEECRDMNVKCENVKSIIIIYNYQKQ